MPPWTLRAVRPDDAEVISVVLDEGFASYRSFAPQGWEPPAGELEPLRTRLGDPDVWCFVAEAGGALAGHVSLMPASSHRRWPSPRPDLGHLWQLFVRPAFWGTGLATELHTRMVCEAGIRGFREMRLFTPLGQSRARRFYEREGWRSVGDPFDERGFGMELLEYRRPISISV